MLCEKCKTAEATVHIDEVIGTVPDEIRKRDFCAACFSQTDVGKKLSGKVADGTSYGFTAAIVSEDETDR